MFACTQSRNTFKFRRFSFDLTPVQAGSHDDLWVERTKAPETLRADLGQGREVDVEGTSLDQASLNQLLCRVRRTLQREIRYRAVA